MPSADSSPWEVLVNSADPRWVVAHRALPTRARPVEYVNARVLARTASGREIPFMLELTLEFAHAVPTIRVTESAPRRLPEFCPDRHIVADGSFCITRDALPPPDTVERGRFWWRVLGGYLDLQVRADLLGEWEDRYAWPHGDAAADLLDTAERLEERLPADVTAWVHAGSLPKPNDACPCGGGRPSQRCHLALMEALMAARAQVRIHNEAYFRAFSDRPCCGTLKSCLLRSSTPAIYRSRRGYRAEGRV